MKSHSEFLKEFKRDYEKLSDWSFRQKYSQGKTCIRCYKGATSCEWNYYDTKCEGPYEEEP